jgi:hypothetical protein
LAGAENSQREPVHGGAFQGKGEHKFREPPRALRPESAFIPITKRRILRCPTAAVAAARLRGNLWKRCGETLRSMTLITPQLALGDWEDPFKYSQHVDAFLCCAREVQLPKARPGLHLTLDDGFTLEDEALDAAFQFLDEQLQAKRLVLIYCGQGRSRSVSVLIGYLALKGQEAPDRILDRIRKLRPGVSPSASTFRSIVAYVNRKRLSQP